MLHYHVLLVPPILGVFYWWSSPLNSEAFTTLSILSIQRGRRLGEAIDEGQQGV